MFHCYTLWKRQKARGIGEIEMEHESRTLTFQNFLMCFNDSPSKMKKNAFCFILKAPFVLKIFNFCLDFLGMQKKRLD